MIMDNILFFIAYIIGYIATCSLFVKYTALKWTYRDWKNSDTIKCIIFSTIWPASIILIISAVLYMRNDKPILPFSKWFYEDKIKITHRKN